MNTDQIQKQTLLRAPINRVWRALSDSAEFGAWFGMRVDGPFEPGRRLHAVIVPTTVDREVAALQKPYEGKPFEIAIEQMEPERLFSFRWTHDDPETGVATPASTLVVFTLEEREDGTMLTVTESGFDQIPLERRAKMFAANDQGWAIQMKLVEAYLAANP
jgi:uncharacterized protein YndB with AHSA1/START domain